MAKQGSLVVQNRRSKQERALQAKESIGVETKEEEEEKEDQGEDEDEEKGKRLILFNKEDHYLHLPFVMNC